MTARLAREEGWALVTAIAMMAMMMGIGLSGFAYVDGQQRQSAVERHRESALNLGEGVLGAETFLVARNWPGSQSAQFPRFCTNATTSDPRCPDPAAVGRAFATGDYGGSSWVVSVRDNGGASSTYYDYSSDDDLDASDSDDDVADDADDIGDTGTDGQPTYDANADGRVWVRAQATVQGRRRTLVALVGVDELVERFPRNPITAGKFVTTNSGRKVIVDTKGPSAASSPISVRCATRTDTCLGYDQSKGQVSPDNTLLALADGGQSLSDEALDRLRQRAAAIGSYYATCPSNPSGELVFVESGDCRYPPVTGPCCNSAAAPGVLVIARGSLLLEGNLEFHGVIYMANKQGSDAANVVELGGTALVKGSIAIDGSGGLTAGSSGTNVIYDENVFGSVRTYPTGAVVPSTWREIPG